MRNYSKRAAKWSGITLILWASILNAQTTHEVMVGDSFFAPSILNIEVGDTVRWVNPANGGAGHNLVSGVGLWTPPAIAESWTFEFTFADEGSFDYWCTPHRSFGMTGVVNVTDPNAGSGSGVDLSVSHNGNWWSGTTRDGEGAQVELSDAGGGELVFVTTVYSYAPEGGQMFLIAVGTPDGESVTVDVFITDGGMWGADFDPADVNQIPWGTGVVTSGGCDALSMTLTPNATYMALGYTEFSYDLIRLTTSLIACEEPDAN